jgi:phage-related protein
MAGNVSIKITGDPASAKRAFKDVGDSAGGLSGKFQGLMGSVGKLAAGFVGLAAIGKTAQYFKEAAQEGAKETQQIERMSKALADNAGVTAEGVEQVEAWIASTQRATATADNELREALIKLTSSTKDVKLSQEMLATALDIAKARGLDLNTVILAMEKGYNGSVGGLSRLGIATKDASGETMSFEQVMKNAINTYGGAAANAAQTTAGKMENLTLMFGDMKEELGKALLPVVEKFATFLMDNMPMIEGVMTSFVQVVAAGLDGLSTTVVPLLQQAFEAFGRIMELLMPAIGVLIEGLHPIIEALQKIFEKVWKAIEYAVQAFVDFFAGESGQALINGLCEGIAQVLETLGLVFEKVWPLAQKVIQVFIDFWNSASGQKLINTLFELVGAGLQTLSDIFEALWPLIEAAVQLFLDFFEGVGAPLITGLLTMIVGMLNTMKDVWEKVWGALAPFLEKLKGPLEAAFKVMRAPIDALIWLIEKAKDLWDWFTGNKEKFGAEVSQQNRDLVNAYEAAKASGAKTIIVGRDGEIISRQHGGSIPGSGPIPIIAHGGEYMLTEGDTGLMRELISAVKSGGLGGGIQIVNNWHGTDRATVLAGTDAMVTRLQALGVRTS